MTARIDQRRQPRLAVACRVEVRDRFTTWSCEAVNVGPRGCLLVTPRSLKLGALLQLCIASERLEERLEAAGQVVWTQAGSPFRAGICFTGATSGTSTAKWFDAFLAVGIEEALRSGARPAGVADLKVYLGAPPALGTLHAGELELVRTIGEGALLADVLDAQPDAVRSLLARGRLTFARAEAVGLARWATALSRKVEPAAPAPANMADVEQAAPGEETVVSITAGAELVEHHPAEFELVIAEPDELAPQLSRLLEFAVDALLDGNVPAAERFLRRAQATSPGDVTSKLILRRIAAHDGSRAQRRIVALAVQGGGADTDS